MGFAVLVIASGRRERAGLQVPRAANVNLLQALISLSLSAVARFAWSTFVVVKKLFDSVWAKARVREFVCCELVGCAPHAFILIGKAQKAPHSRSRCR
jgi:hypothetical protein